ncbi:hypothetical protein LMH73_002505 [Vibrio splendidus]|nr:hypothetical protein [Vibrio splendidus]MCC4880454.1 hypothetical protein [Vibrio splendidus]
MLLVTVIPILTGISMFFGYVPPIVGAVVFIGQMFLISDNAQKIEQKWSDTIDSVSSDEDVLIAFYSMSKSMRSITVGAITNTALAITTLHIACKYNNSVTAVIAGFIGAIIFIAMIYLWSNANRVYSDIKGVKEARIHMLQKKAPAAAVEKRLDSIEDLIHKDAEIFMENMRVLAQAQQEMMEHMKDEDRKIPKKL